MISSLASASSCWHAAASSARSSENADDERAQRARGDSATCGCELRGGEVVLLGVFLELGADDLDAAAEAAANRVEQLLAAHSPGVPQHEVGVVGRVLEVAQGLGDEGVGALLDIRDADEARLAEQRRARDGHNLAGRILVGLDVADLEARVFGAQGVAQNANGATSARHLGAAHENDRRRAHAIPRENRNSCLHHCHALSLTAGPDADLVRCGAEREQYQPVTVGTQRHRANGSENVEQQLRRMPVGVVRTDTDQPDGGGGVLVGGGRLVGRAVMGDLDDVDLINGLAACRSCCG